MDTQATNQIQYNSFNSHYSICICICVCVSCMHVYCILYMYLYLYMFCCLLSYLYQPRFVEVSNTNCTRVIYEKEGLLFGLRCDAASILQDDAATEWGILSSVIYSIILRSVPLTGAFAAISAFCAAFCMKICSVRFCSLHRIPIRVLLNFANSTGSPAERDQRGIHQIRYNINNILPTNYHNSLNKLYNFPTNFITI